MQEKKKKLSYLERIVFDPNLWKSWIAKYITNIRIVLLLTITIITIGLVSYTNLPRRLNPEIKIPIITVSTVLPGAAPEDIESLVTIPLENEFQGLTGLDVITSTSLDNVSIITMQFTNQTGQDKAKANVQSAVDSFTSLPKDALTPKVNGLDFENQPVWQFAITAKNNDIASLMNVSKLLKDKLDDVPKIDHVQLQGFEQQEIVVEMKPEKIQTYGLNPLQLSQAIKGGIVSFPAGSVDTGRNSFTLTIDPSIQSINDIRNLRLNVQGTIVKLGDIASVLERSKSNQRVSFLAHKDVETRRAVTFDIYKTSTADIDATAKAAKVVTDSVFKQYGDRFTLTTINNSAEEINTQFVDLLGEFRSTIILVFVCLFIFLGLRQAIISSFTVPLTFLSAFVFMQMFGMSINFLSLFAFLLALGLLVDDTIVVVSAMTTYYKTKRFTPNETGLIVWRDTIVPIWSTTITTIWSFVPLLLTSGIIGEFIKPIPIVVSVTMISSTAIAVLVTLPLMIVLLKPNLPKRIIVLAKVILTILAIGIVVFLLKGNPLFIFVLLLYIALFIVGYRIRKILWNDMKKVTGKIHFLPKLTHIFLHSMNHGIIDLDGLGQAYYRLISRILASKSARRKVIFAIVLYAIIAFSLLPLGFVKNEFFPKSDSKLVYINLELPPGTTLEKTQYEAGVIFDKVRMTPDTEFVALQMGTSMGGGFAAATENSNLAVFTLHLLPEKNRHQSSQVIAEKLRQEWAGYTAGKLSVIEQTGGPPAGADIQIKLSGDDLGELTKYADTIITHLKAQPGLTNIDKSIKPGTSALVFVPDKDKLAAAGLTIDSIGLWTRMYASGFSLGDVNFDKTKSEKTNVLFSFGKERPTPESIGKVMIQTGNSSVSLISLGSVHVKANPTIITREDGKRTISVSATVLRGFSLTDKNKELQTYIPSLHLPSGYEWKTGGVNEENAKSIQSILQAMGLSFLLILATMVIQFRSYRQAIIVLIVIPLAVSSVFVAFALTGTPLSFPALIGVLSLFGIVVTNSMFIVDKINLNIKEGMGFKESIADAGASRMEPIILTKLCTVLGLLPITISNPLWRGLGGAIISGLLIASTIMLLFIPVVYYSWMKPSDEKKIAPTD